MHNAPLVGTLIVSLNCTPDSLVVCCHRNRRRTSEVQLFRSARNAAVIFVNGLLAQRDFESNSIEDLDLCDRSACLRPRKLVLGLRRVSLRAMINPSHPNRTRCKINLKFIEIRRLESLSSAIRR